jgi:hypothetical protein
MSCRTDYSLRRHNYVLQLKGSQPYRGILLNSSKYAAEKGYEPTFSATSSQHSFNAGIAHKKAHNLSINNGTIPPIVNVGQFLTIIYLGSIRKSLRLILKVCYLLLICLLSTECINRFAIVLELGRGL